MTRIIAGAAGSLRLDVPRSGTRPTSDRVREAVFSALEARELLAGARVLDLYAGSGALGLEAASRGAAAVTLVERHAQAAQVAGRNTRTVLRALPDPAPEVSVVRQSAASFLTGCPEAPLWEVVFLDPPYELGEPELADALAALVPRLAPGGVTVVERLARSPEPRWPTGLVPARHRRFGDTALWWASRPDLTAP